MFPQLTAVLSIRALSAPRLAGLVHIGRRLMQQSRVEIVNLDSHYVFLSALIDADICQPHKIFTHKPTPTVHLRKHVVQISQLQ